MLLRKVLCAVAILGLSIGLAFADDITGRITKIDDKKVTVETGKKGDVKTNEYDIGKDCKFAKMEKKTKVELADGIKNEVFKDLPKKGLAAKLNVVDGKVTEIIVTAKKKDNK